jgi:phosphoglycolate phosphatase
MSRRATTISRRPADVTDLVLFDLDGTLTDSQPGIAAAYRHTLDVLGLETDAATLRRCVGPPIRDSFLLFGVPRADVEEAVAVYRAWFVPNGMFDNRLYDGIVEMLERVKGTGVPMGVATSKLRAHAVTILDHFGIDAFFDPVCGATPDGRLTHKDEVVADALIEAGVEGSEQVLMVGDREHDMWGAAANGAVPIGVRWGYGSQSELESAGARWIVDTPAELADLIVSLAAT